MLVPEFKQPYVVVNGVSPSFALSGRDGSKGIVEYAGSARASGGSAYSQRNPGLFRALAAGSIRALCRCGSAAQNDDTRVLLSQIKSLLGEPDNTQVEVAKERVERMPNRRLLRRGEGVHRSI